MADLLLPARAVPSAHGMQRTKDAEALARRSSRPERVGALVGALSRTCRGANDLLRSWKDGLTAEQRERARLREERKHVLRLRIKTVGARPLRVPCESPCECSNADAPCRPSRSPTGKPRRRSSTPSRATTPGSATPRPATTTAASSRSACVPSTPRACAATSAP